MNFSLHTLSTREKVLGALVGSALLTLVCKFTIFDQWKELRLVDSQISQLQSEVAESQIKLATQPARKPASMAPPNGNSPVVDRYVQENSRLGNVLNVISEMENEKKLFSVTKITSEKHESNKDYDKILFNMELDTSFLGLGSFLETLEQSEVLSRVESVIVTRIGEDLKKCHAQIKFYTFSLRENR